MVVFLRFGSHYLVSALCTIGDFKIILTILMQLDFSLFLLKIIGDSVPHG